MKASIPLKHVLLRRLIKSVLILNLTGIAPSAGAADWIGRKAPDFTLKAVGSEDTHRLSDLKGKIVVIDFWATWCAPCRKSLPNLVRLRKKYSAFLQVLAVSIDDNEETAHRFLTEYNIDLLALFDGDKAVAGLYDIPEMPTMLIVDRRGIVNAVFNGYTEDRFDEIENQIRKLK